jgi:hypothetical protein
MPILVLCACFKCSVYGTIQKERERESEREGERERQRESFCIYELLD